MKIFIILAVITGEELFHYNIMFWLLLLLIPINWSDNLLYFLKIFLRIVNCNLRSAVSITMLLKDNNQLFLGKRLCTACRAYHDYSDVLYFLN